MLKNRNARHPTGCFINSKASKRQQGCKETASFLFFRELTDQDVAKGALGASASALSSLMGIMNRSISILSKIPVDYSRCIFVR